MTSQKNILSLLVLGASAVTLAACSSMGYPNIMPSGYTHHHQEYKSATPAPSSRVNAEQRQYMDATQAEQFRDAVYDLLTKVTMRAGMPPKPTYVLSPEPMTVFYTNIDNDLRESMRTIGYAISDTPEGAYVFTYSAQSLVAASAGQPNVELSLNVYNSANPSAQLLTHETGEYFIQGVDTLNIKPTSHAIFSTETKNLNQTSAEPAHPMAQYEVIPMAEEPALMEQDIEETFAPSVEILDTTSYSVEPSQSVTIDSSLLSYEDAPAESAYQPSTSLPRVSKEVLY